MMKDIKKLIEAAHNEDLVQFEKELHKMRIAVSAVATGTGNGGHASSTSEKSLLFVCGYLSSQPEDLRAFAKTLWKYWVAQGRLNSNNDWACVQSDLSTVLLASCQQNAWELIEDFKREIQPTLQFPHAPDGVVSKTLMDWIPDQDWAFDDVLLKNLVETNQIGIENLLIKSVRKGNVSTLSWLIHNVDAHEKSNYAFYVAGNWSQRVVEQQTPEQIQSNFKENDAIFEVIKPYFNLDEFIDCGLVERCQDNPPNPLPINIGAMYWPIQEAHKWDGLSPIKPHAAQYRQFNVLLQHMPLPETTEHFYTLNKMYKMCPEELPRLQEWFDHMENARLHSHVDGPKRNLKKKM